MRKQTPPSKPLDRPIPGIIPKLTFDTGIITLLPTEEESTERKQPNPKR